MYVLAQSVPFKPNYSKLAEGLDVNRTTIYNYIEYLESSQLFNALREKGSGDAIMRKAEKLYLGNSNIAYAISDTRPDEGNVRETMFLAWMSVVHNVTSSKISDFEIDGITFEVGGKNKKGRQVKEAEKAYLVKDNMEYVFGNSVPIWMFGFIY